MSEIGEPEAEPRANGESQSWRDLIALAGDVVFETDEWGCFTFAAADPALGWDTRALIGQTAGSMRADPQSAFDPFRISAKAQRRPAWVRKGGAAIACLSFSVAPIIDESGRIVGARGIGIAQTQDQGTVSATHRAAALENMLLRVAGESESARMMIAALGVLAGALHAEGTGIARHQTDLPGAPDNTINLAVARYLDTDAASPAAEITANGSPVLIAGCQRVEKTALVVWRAAGDRPWDAGEIELAASAARLIRLILDRDFLQSDEDRRGRTDYLTLLLNRPAFLEEIERHATRADRDAQPGTLMLISLDNFRQVNDRMGQGAGDAVLRRTAGLMRETFRPSDVIGRLSGDEFAVWLNAADHMTAAERAEHLRESVPRVLSEIREPEQPRLTVSIGIASREQGDGEATAELMRRAGVALREVKQTGGGHWRVSLRKRP
jgi:diguanylate cyclase (GGDEF)-like protein